LKRPYRIYQSSGWRSAALKAKLNLKCPFHPNPHLPRSPNLSRHAVPKLDALWQWRLLGNGPVLLRTCFPVGLARACLWRRLAVREHAKQARQFELLQAAAQVLADSPQADLRLKTGVGRLDEDGNLAYVAEGGGHDVRFGIVREGDYVSF
jgi:hypothetical protein